MDMLSITGLYKQFGENRVISDLNFTVPEGAVFGFVGENGAGKTTTMKMITGLLKPTSGNIAVCGERVEYGSNKTNKYLGYLPDVPEFYSYMTSMEYLNLCGNISGMGAKEIKLRSEEMLKLVGLEGVKKRIGTFSRGMKQRLGIAQALLHTPKLLICDEPTSALDPVGRSEILEILSCIKEKTTVLFSTHILSDVERICDHIGILNNGKLVVDSKIEEFKKTKSHDEILVEFGNAGDAENTAEKIKVLPFVKDVKLSGKRADVLVNDIENVGVSILSLLIESGAFIEKYEISEPSLESLFLEVIGK